MYVVKHETFRGDHEEHAYQEAEIQIRGGIAVVEHVETKDYMFKLGYELLGEIPSRDMLDDFLAGKINKPAEVQADDHQAGGTDRGLPSSESLASPQDNAEKFWWQRD